MATTWYRKASALLVASAMVLSLQATSVLASSHGDGQEVTSEQSHGHDGGQDHQSGSDKSQSEHGNQAADHGNQGQQGDPAKSKTDCPAVTEGTDDSATTGTPTDPSGSTGTSTGTSTDPAAGTSTDPAAGTSTDPAAGTSTDPAAGTSTDPSTGTATDPSTSTDPSAPTTNPCVNLTGHGKAAEHNPNVDANGNLMPGTAGQQDPAAAQDAAQAQEQAIAKVKADSLAKAHADRKNGEKGAYLVYVNGDRLNLTPLAHNGRTLVPFRNLAEYLGAQVSWDPATRMVTMVKGDTTVQITIGSTTALVNGQPVDMSLAPEINDGHTFVPLRFIATALGAAVDYDSATGAITVITSPAPTDPGTGTTDPGTSTGTSTSTGSTDPAPAPASASAPTTP